ncbi:MAG: amino acid ABC transporter ATP-binding protein [Synergistaceae bacterium]|nr:amino acid ABC transporter ATP-binding protein [Synergistaceae bacterium]
MIKLEHLKKVYPNVTPIKDLSAEIQDGEIISIIGPSGTGKSTLLRCINLLERPTRGKIFFHGQEITHKHCNIPLVRQKMGMVFQSFNLFGHLTVIENIMLAPVKLKHVSRQDAYDNGIKLLRQVGLVNKALNYPDELSGGQKQRIAIARALAMDPEVILFDEPTSALDPTMIGEVQAVIRELAGTGKTMMIVTHEMKFARSIATRVFYLDEGGIYEEGTPDKIFVNPEREKTRRFIRNLKVLEIVIDSHTFDFPGIVSQIESYCNKNLVPSRIANHLQLACEELTRQILLPVMNEPEIKFTAEYSESDNKIDVKVSYNGEKFNPFDSDNNLSVSMLQKITKDFNHEMSNDGSNVVKFSV